MKINWYDMCSFRYPRNYMTYEQLDRILSLGLITQEEYNDIKLIPAMQ